MKKNRWTEMRNCVAFSVLTHEYMVLAAVVAWTGKGKLSSYIFQYGRWN